FCRRRVQPHRRRAGRIRPGPRRIGQRNPPGVQLKTGWSWLAILGRPSQTTSKSTSLAQQRVAAHQEYQWRVFQSSLLSAAENASLLSARLYGLVSCVDRNFHRFLPPATYALWIWLESEYI